MADPTFTFEEIIFKRIDMKRGEAIKWLAAMGSFAIFAGIRILENSSKGNLHFVALGSGGTNAMAFIHKKGIKANYSCFTSPYVSHLTSDIKHIFWETPREYCVLGENYMTPLLLTNEMKSVFSGNETFVILAGLGGSVGTGFIFDALKFLWENQKKYMAICTLPMQCEGKSRNQYARLKQQEICKMNNVHFIDNEHLYKIYPEISTIELFEKANEKAYHIFRQYSLQLN